MNDPARAAAAAARLNRFRDGESLGPIYGDKLPLHRLYSLLREDLNILIDGRAPVAATLATVADDDTPACFVCDLAFKAGDRVIDDITEGPMHFDCCGTEREAYVNADGEPLGPNDPIPQGYIWDPEEHG